MKHAHAADPTRMFLVGPEVVVLTIALFAIVVLCAVAFGRIQSLGKLLEDGADRLNVRRVVPMLWGLAATVLIFLLSLTLIQTKVLGLLGVVVFVFGLVLWSIGMGIAAIWAGSNWLTALEVGDEPATRSITWGSIGLLLGSCVPVVGWIVVVGIWASGFGTLLELVVARKRASSEAP